MIHKLLTTGRLRPLTNYRPLIQHPNHIALALKAKLTRQDINRFKAAYAAAV
jgi:hypothetical protein